MKDIDIVFSKVRMKDLLESYGIMPSRNGKYVCPIHKDVNPSASIRTTDKDWFKCFGCGVNLNVIDFVVKYEKCSRKVAIGKLDKQFGVGLFSDLTPQEERELARKKAEREKRLAREKCRAEFERETLDKIAHELRFWERVDKSIMVEPKSKYQKQFNQRYEILMYSAEKQRWLEWLYNAVCGFEQPECEFDYTIGNDKKEILRKIYKGEICVL